MKTLLQLSLSLLATAFVSSACYATKTPVDTLGAEDHQFAPSVNVVNNTDYDVEDIILWATDYLGIENVTICVAYQQKRSQEEGVVVKHKNIYFLYLKENLISFRTIIMHELIHVRQYEEKDLVTINPHTVSYKGYVMNLKKTEYLRRPYELEAHSKDSQLLRKYFKQKKALRKASEREDHAADSRCALAANNAEN